MTYNPRSDKKIEEKVKRASENLSKLLMVTGPTKSGKTVVTNKIFSRDTSIWFDCGAYEKEDDLWEFILDELDGYTSLQKTTHKTESRSASGKFVGESPLRNMKGEIGGKVEVKDEDGSIKGRSISAKNKAINILRNSKVPLVLDDFHYLPREDQGRIVRAIKGLVFGGFPVVFIAIPHRRLDATKVEREMTGRVEVVNIPTWEEYELKTIPETGFRLLNIEIDNKIIDRLTEEALGSPHLMQDFCYYLCDMKGINETQKNLVKIKEEEETFLQDLFTKVAENTGKIMFQKLARGPRQRSDRMERRLKNGIATDIYSVVLFALANMKPGLVTIEYEELRTQIREIVVDKAPQAHEVTRVLDHMSRIAADDESSTPVIDWESEERTLHITDPFFAYYLRWGEELMEIRN